MCQSAARTVWLTWFRGDGTNRRYTPGAPTWRRGSLFVPEMRSNANEGIALPAAPAKEFARGPAPSIPCGAATLVSPASAELPMPTLGATETRFRRLGDSDALPEQRTEATPDAR